MSKKFNYVVATATTIAMLGFASPALAGGNNNGGDVEIENKASIEVSNWGMVVNTTTASASTGGNFAGGSEGGDGGNGGDGEEGGDADADADADNKGDADAEADGGNGGNGGKGGTGGSTGTGGTVATGDATAEAGSMNVVNSNDLAIEGCGCGSDVEYDEDNVDDIEVEDKAEIKLKNGAFVINHTDATAKTGWNVAKGSEGGDAGNGGDGEEGGKADADADSDGDGDADADAEGGNGGNGGKGGKGGFGGTGGLVVTGDALSAAGSINVVNTNLVRITR